MRKKKRIAHCLLLDASLNLSSDRRLVNELAAHIKSAFLFHKDVSLADNFLLTTPNFVRLCATDDFKQWLSSPNVYFAHDPAISLLEMKEDYEKRQSWHSSVTNDDVFYSTVRNTRFLKYMQKLIDKRTIPYDRQKVRNIYQRYATGEAFETPFARQELDRRVIDAVKEAFETRLKEGTITQTYWEKGGLEDQLLNKNKVRLTAQEWAESKLVLFKIGRAYYFQSSIDSLNELGVDRYITPMYAPEHRSYPTLMGHVAMTNSANEFLQPVDPSQFFQLNFETNILNTENIAQLSFSTFQGVIIPSRQYQDFINALFIDDDSTIPVSDHKRQLSEVTERYLRFLEEILPKREDVKRRSMRLRILYWRRYLVSAANSLRKYLGDIAQSDFSTQGDSPFSSFTVLQPEEDRNAALSTALLTPFLQVEKLRNQQTLLKATASLEREPIADVLKLKRTHYTSRGYGQEWFNNG